MVKRALTSCFGLGLLPWAPGTFGSVPAAVIFWVLGYFKVAGWVIAAVMGGLVFLSSLVCVKFGPAVAAMRGKKDPGEIVADEVAGQALVFLIVGLFSITKWFFGWDAWQVAVGGFVLFRVFDIIKPWPICKLEKLPDGWGVLADDLAAGVFAAIVLILAISVLTGLVVSEVLL